MRRVLLAAVAGLTFVTAVGAGAGTTAASLRLVAQKPLVVGGRGFHASERVRLTLVAGELIVHRQQATSRSGTFRVSFGNVPTGHCSSFVVRAAGFRGDAATLRHMPLPQCMPAGSSSSR